RSNRIAMPSGAVGRLSGSNGGSLGSRERVGRNLSDFLLQTETESTRGWGQFSQCITRVSRSRLGYSVLRATRAYVWDLPAQALVGLLQHRDQMRTPASRAVASTIHRDLQRPQDQSPVRQSVA